jgi:hypothetical protein
MPLTNRLYFAQVASSVWADWIQVVNVSGENAKIQAIARDWNGNILWSSERMSSPFQGWVIPVEPASVTQNLSLVVLSDKAISGERHCHNGTEVLAFPGASPELGTAGLRLFFPELVAECADWFIVFNITNIEAQVDAIVRDVNGAVVKQFSTRLKGMGGWVFSDVETGRVAGTVEVVSEQMIVAERHLHYQGTFHPNGVAIGQLGQVIDIEPAIPPPFIFPMPLGR